MRLKTDPQVPDPKAGNFQVALQELFRQYAKQVNGISEGKVAFVTNAYTAAPTGDQWAQGDFVLNSTPAELGTAGAKYIVHGFRCTVAGTPGTWVPVRTLTGN